MANHNYFRRTNALKSLSYAPKNSATADKKNSQVKKGRVFEGAFKQFWSQLYHHALCKLNDPEVAEDLIKEWFIVLWNNEKLLFSGEELQSYLYGVLCHKILDIFRKDQVRLKYQMAMQETHSDMRPLLMK